MKRRKKESRNRKEVKDLLLFELSGDLIKRWSNILLTLSPRWRLLKLEYIRQMKTLTAMERHGIIQKVRVDRLRFFVRLTDNGCDLRNHYIRRKIAKEYKKGSTK